MIKRLIVIISVMLPQVALTQNLQSDATIIRSYRAASNAAIANHDLAGISKYWLPDFVQTRGNGTSLTGRDTIIAIWRDLFKTNTTVVYERNPIQVIVGSNGIMAWETGVWTAKNSYSNGGNYSAMWRKVDGVWKLQAELFVTLK